MSKVKVFLSLAVVLGLASVTPLAAGWQVMSLGLTAPEGHPLQGGIDVWRAAVRFLHDGGLISSSRADDWRLHGIGVDHLLQTLAVIAVVLAWIASLVVPGQSEVVTRSPEVREVAVGVAQLEHAMANVLLDPQARPIAEPLTDIARQLHKVSDALSSLHADKVD
ncbi:MAG: hypothetical protein FGM18_03710 [Burkholderiaceae bacterium]|nr:hypothetical protein [Burkholderiaceae bacterium]